MNRSLSRSSACRSKPSPRPKLEVVEFDYEHLLRLRPQPRHADAHRNLLVLGPETVNRAAGSAWTLMRGDQPVAVAGVVGDLCWALLGDSMRRGEMIVAHRVACKVLFDYFARGRLLYAEIDGRFPEGVRWARMLGFEPQVDGWEDGVTLWCCTNPPRS